MFKDFEAVTMLSTDIQGHSIHRRGISGPGGRFFDFHARVPTRLMDGTKFTPIYCQSLGCELSNLDVKLFQEYLVLLFDSVGDLNVIGPNNVIRDPRIFLVTPDHDTRLFDALRNSLLAVCIGNYMSELFCFSH